MTPVDPDGVRELAAFGLAPQPKGIGDRRARVASLPYAQGFGLAPQPKGIGDTRWGSIGYGGGFRFGLAPQPKGIGDMAIRIETKQCG